MGDSGSLHNDTVCLPSALGQWEWNSIALCLIVFLLLEICVFVWGKEGSTDEKRTV